MSDGMQHEFTSLSLKNLVDLVAGGSVVLPEFQRQFVWDPDQVVELLDSVANGWPIGSLLMLEGPQPFGLKQIQDGPEVSPEGARYHLLDGQQRVTSIFHALTDTSDTVYYSDLGRDEESGEPRFRWVKRERFSRIRSSDFVYKVSQLANGEAFDSLTSHLPSSEAISLKHLRNARMGSLVEMTYPVPFILLKQDIELEALTRIFETLNRTGLRLDAFDLMVAVLYPSGFQLRDEWLHAVKSEPILKHYKVKGLELLKLAALWQRDIDRVEARRPSSRRVKGVRQSDVLNIPPDFVRGQWGRAVDVYVESLQFLRDVAGVTDADGVPSTSMILTIGYLSTTPGVTHDRVVEWYWRAIARQSYAQGANTQVIRDIDRLVEGQAPEEVERETLISNLLDSVRRNRILRLGLRGSAVARSVPDPLTGEPIHHTARDFLFRPPEYHHRPDRLAVVDLVFCSEETASAINAVNSPDATIELLRADALLAQGIDSTLEGEEFRFYRAQFLADWLRG